MNKTVKILLAIALGLLFPVFTFLLAITIFPDQKRSSLERPISPSYEECYSNRNTNGTRPSRVIDEFCRRRVQSTYDQDLKSYEKRLAEAETLSKQALLSRIKLALVVAIIGFIVALAAWKTSPVAVGMASGSTLIIVVASGYAASISKQLDKTTEILFLVSFVILLVMLIFIDKVFPMIASPSKPENDQTQPMPASPQSAGDNQSKQEKENSKQDQ